MAIVEVNNTVITKVFMPTDIIWTKATESTANTSQTLVIKPKAKDSQLTILIHNAYADGGYVTYAFSEGILGSPLNINDLTINKIEPEKMIALKIDSAFVMKTGGTIEITFTPETAYNLSSCKLGVAVIENIMSV